jgi:hypothetical protein
MQLENLFKDASDFLSGKKKIQLKKSQDLNKIINQLIINRDKLKKEHKIAPTKKKKKVISKEYKAVVKLLSKAQKRYKQIK